MLTTTPYRSGLINYLFNLSFYSRGLVSCVSCTSVRASISRLNPLHSLHLIGYHLLLVGFSLWSTISYLISISIGWMVALCGKTLLYWFGNSG